MLFNTFISVTASEIAQTEKFISQLQQQLETARQTLATLQQQQQLELTAKGAAESALETALKAYKAVFAAYGEEGVKEFQAALANLAVDSEQRLAGVPPVVATALAQRDRRSYPKGDIPVLSLSAATDEEPTEPENITPPPPSEPEVETEVIITPVIESDNVNSEPHIEPQEEKEEEGESQPEKVDLEKHVTLPKMSAVREMKKDEVIRYLQTYNLPTDGVIKDLKSRLTAYIIQKRSVQKAIA